MDIDYDSEFIDRGNRITPLSIGFVRDDGEELYRVWNSELALYDAVNDPWLRENVVSSLPVTVHGTEDSFIFTWDENHPDFEYVKPVEQIRQDVEDFLLEPVLKGGSITLWAWYAAYDHVLLAQIFGKMLDLPAGIPMFTCDLKQEHVRLGEPTLPRQKEGQHNSLADARHNRVIRETLKEIERSRLEMWAR